MRFIDTNVLLYAISTDPDEQAKRAIAVAILERPDIGFSIQVFQEFYHQATRPGRLGALSHRMAVGVVTSSMRFPVQPMTLDVLFDAFRIRSLTGFSYWDSAILAAARALGCDEVLTEDLAHGRTIEGVAIVNPFRSAA
ncbi:PIN domain-containing protein [Phreatobacter oligotrophus]|uniref:Putative nucleic acid-binding protein n=1 Tax=Phreatobacter oligotrophus TaxID=1122261 RepID=A0A2T4ZG32_9HYPH|nr:PIN domain-containing protein [Phreatobacter oligotrophus]PTM60872.1 putative nucleic acid-binding protein [Phreatobacter oligotrophus]